MALVSTRFFVIALAKRKNRQGSAKKIPSFSTGHFFKGCAHLFSNHCAPPPLRAFRALKRRPAQRPSLRLRTPTPLPPDSGGRSPAWILPAPRYAAAPSAVPVARLQPEAVFRCGLDGTATGSAATFANFAEAVKEMRASGFGTQAARLFFSRSKFFYVMIRIMKKGIDDPSYSPGSFVFGHSVCDLAVFGEGPKYPANSILEDGAFGGQFDGLDVEARIFPLAVGPPDARSPRVLADAPMASTQVRGKWRNRIIYQVINGKQRRRRYTPYDSSPKPHLTPFMPKFAEAVALWKTFPAETRSALNARASKLGLQYSGYNFWIKLWLKDDPARVEYLP